MTDSLAEARGNLKRAFARKSGHVLYIPEILELPHFRGQVIFLPNSLVKSQDWPGFPAYILETLEDPVFHRADFPAEQPRKS